MKSICSKTEKILSNMVEIDAREGYQERDTPHRSVPLLACHA
ncbi:MAG: hypothetical protein ACTSYQ_02360 [Candidatus Odinarchaeia archaeon]